MPALYCHCKRSRNVETDHFTIAANWEDEASVWNPHRDEIPVVADAPPLDERLGKISAIVLDLLPEITRASTPRPCFLQIAA